MSSEDNKALSRRLIEELWNRKNVDVVDKLFAADYVEHSSGIPLDRSEGLEGLKQFFSLYLTAFPDVHVTVEDQIAREDKVMTRMTWSGTHTGKLTTIEPTNEQVEVMVVSIDRIADGQIVEGWSHINVPGILYQLDFFSTPPAIRRGRPKCGNFGTCPNPYKHCIAGQCWS